MMFKAFVINAFQYVLFRISASKVFVRGSQALIIMGAVSLTFAEGNEYIGDERKG